MPDQKEKILRVLIADDSSVMRVRVALLISQLPQVRVIGGARDGKEALDQTRALRPDVLILDLRMPQMSGWDVLKLLRQEQYQSFVIVLTNQDESIYRDRAIAAGADRFLSKATQMDELEVVIRELVSLRFKQE